MWLCYLRLQLRSGLWVVMIVTVTCNNCHCDNDCECDIDCESNCNSGHENKCSYDCNLHHNYTVVWRVFPMEIASELSCNFDSKFNGVINCNYISKCESNWHCVQNHNCNFVMVTGTVVVNINVIVVAIHIELWC